MTIFQYSVYYYYYIFTLSNFYFITMMYHQNPFFLLISKPSISELGDKHKEITLLKKYLCHLIQVQTELPNPRMFSYCVQMLR